MKRIFKAKIEQGIIKFNDPQGFAVVKSKLNNKPVEITIQEERKKRSHKQNRYYHGVVIKILSEHTGYSPSEMHEIIKQEFFSSETELNGKTYLLATTTEENTLEFEEKLSLVRSWASCELGCWIPLPIEVEEL